MHLRGHGHAFPPQIDPDRACPLHDGGYFGVNAYTGKYGLNARQELDQEIVALTSELARLRRERAESEQRVSLLRSDRVDPDMLDERARYQLDYANPHDLVRMNNPN